MRTAIITATINGYDISQIVQSPAGNILSFRKTSNNPRLPDTCRWQESPTQSILSKDTQSAMDELFKAGGVVHRVDFATDNVRYNYGKAYSRSYTLQLNTVRKPVVGNFYFLSQQVYSGIRGQKRFRFFRMKFLGVQKRKLSWMDEAEDCRVFEEWDIRTGEIREVESYKYGNRWELGNGKYTIVEVETPRDAKVRVLKNELLAENRKADSLETEMHILKFKLKKQMEIVEKIKREIEEV